MPSENSKSAGSSWFPMNDSFRRGNPGYPDLPVPRPQSPLSYLGFVQKRTNRPAATHSKRKRPSSEPPEQTDPALQTSIPKFSSFRSEGWNRPNTKVPKLRESGISLSFAMAEIVGGAKTPKPSLATADRHSIPPILPVFRSDSSSRRSSTQLNKSRSLSMSGRQSDMPAEHVLNTSFYGRPPSMTLSTIPEDGSLRTLGYSQQSHGAINNSHSDASEYDPNFPNRGCGGPVYQLQYSPATSNSSLGRSIAYGFSYSESGDDDNAEESAFHRAAHGASGTTVAPRGPIINPDTSFQDLVVVHDVKKDWEWMTPAKRSCTHAKLEDTLRIKEAAKSLLAYDESEDIYRQLSNRIERMVRTELDLYNNDVSSTTIPLAKKRRTSEEIKGSRAPSIYACAVQLCDFLRSMKHGRVATGECENFIEHELQWARWFVDASEAGVLHLKVKGCTCRPEWEELNDDELV